MIDMGNTDIVLFVLVGLPIVIVFWSIAIAISVALYKLAKGDL
jgi:hypothetical protein